MVIGGHAVMPFHKFFEPKYNIHIILFAIHLYNTTSIIWHKYHKIFILYTAEDVSMHVQEVRLRLQGLMSLA